MIAKARPWNGLLQFILLIVVSIAFIPFAPKMPASGLDPSWALALNQAVAQGFAFGKQIIFTLGPYSAIYTQAYHPATDLMMILGSGYLAISYWLGLITVLNQRKWPWSVGFALTLLAMIYARDSLLFSYPLLAGLMTYKVLFTTDTQSAKQRLPLVFAGFGLLCLVKGSLIILCSGILVLCCSFFWIYNQKKLACLILLSALGATIICWLAAGQSLINLIAYFVNSLIIAAGFTEAMSLSGDSTEIILYLLMSAVILVSIAYQRPLHISARLFLIGLVSLFLFVSFKTGFTRHFGHAFISGTSIFIASLLLSHFFKNSVAIAIVFSSLLTTLYIDSHYTHISLTNNLVSTAKVALHGINTRLFEKDGLKRNFALTLEYLHQQNPLPPLPGTTDIYSYQQAYLIASENHWLPRPIFQSYSVFNSKLSKMNAEYLSSKASPDHIIFNIQPIDQRVPSLEDGLSWRILLHDYEPAGELKAGVLLQKKLIHTSLPRQQLLSSESHQLNERVVIATNEHPVFAEIAIEPTLLGQLALFFFKSPPLNILIELHNGDKKSFRLVGSLSKAGFLLSPLIENNEEFANLYGTGYLLKGKEVNAITITTPQSYLLFWQSKYTIRLSPAA